MKILNVVGTRPNFIKNLRSDEYHVAVQPSDAVIASLPDSITTKNMARVFFDQLKIPRPDFELEVGSGTNPWQVGEICRRFEQVLNEVEPDVVLVVGDVKFHGGVFVNRGLPSNPGGSC